jgi:hypothetical protein
MRKFSHKNLWDVVALITTTVTLTALIATVVIMFQHGVPNINFTF